MEQTKITNNYSEMLKTNGICSYGIKIEYIQNSDTWSNEGQMQKMTLETIPTDYDEKTGSNGFIRLSLGVADHEAEPDIDPFWSVDSPKEIVDIFNDFAKKASWKVRWDITERIVEE